MILTEKDLTYLVKKTILEYHKGQQLMLPFDGNSEPYNYMHFMEYLESIGKYGTLSSQLDPKDPESYIGNKLETYVEIAEGILEEMIGNEPEDIYYEFFRPFVNKYGLECIRGYIRKEFDDNPDNLLWWWGTFCDEDLRYALDIVNKVLDPHYVNQWNDFMGDLAQKEILNLLQSFITNERGLVYCEREISVPNLMGRADFATPTNPQKDAYEYFRENFSGIGECWSYSVGGGCAYCENTYRANGGATHLLLKGWVRPEDVDLNTTMVLTNYDEVELRLKLNAKVEVDEIVVSKVGKRLPLKSPIILPV